MKRVVEVDSGTYMIIEYKDNNILVGRKVAADYPQGWAWENIRDYPNKEQILEELGIEHYTI